MTCRDPIEKFLKETGGPQTRGNCSVECCIGDVSGRSRYAPLEAMSFMLEIG